MKTLTDLAKEYPNYFGGNSHCGDGWVTLIQSLCELLENKFFRFLPIIKPEVITEEDNRFGFFRQPNEKPTFCFQQIKEKFGTLRIYYSLEFPELDWTIFDKKAVEKLQDEDRLEIRGAVNAIERMSGFICENTGEPGFPCSIHGWHKTLSKKEAKRLDATLHDQE